MKGYFLIGLLSLLPSLASARDSACSFSCVVTDQRRFSSKAEVLVEGTRGRCRGQVLVSSIGTDAQIYAERYYVSEWIREGRAKRVLKIGIPFNAESCRVEFSQEF